MNLAREIHELRQLGRLNAAINVLEKIEFKTLDSEILLFRCLFEQGRFKETKSCGDALISTYSSRDLSLLDIQLRLHFLSIYIFSDPASAIAAYQTVLSEHHDIGIQAIAHDLLGRALAIAITYTLAPVTEWESVYHHLHCAVQAYERADNTDASLGAWIKLGQVRGLSPNPDLEAIHSIFQHAHDQAETVENPSRQAEALLHLAELEFDTIVSQISGDLSFEQLQYCRVLQLYERIGHGIGPADVLLSFGQRLLKTGFDGSVPLNQALRIYQQQHNLIGQYNALIALSTWTLQQGHLDESFQYRRAAVERAEEMGFPLAQATAQLGIGDHYYRKGEYAQALGAYEQVEHLTTLPGVRAMQGLMLANAYMLMNLSERAVHLCQESVATLLPIGPTPTLSLGYFIWGNALTNEGQWAEAIPVWRQGLVIDKALNRSLEQAEKLSCIAQASVMQHQTSFPDVPSADYAYAMKLCAEAIELLQTLNTPEAFGAIAATQQLQGQLSMVGRQFEQAVTVLEIAYRTYKALGLDMQGAITSSLIGLALHGWASQGYPKKYAPAKDAYQQALDYFQATGMMDMSWKTRYHLAHTCFRQGWLALTTEAQHDCWQQADDHLRDAASTIDQLRAGFVNFDAMDTQATRLGIVVNKEKIYTFAVELHYKCLKNSRTAWEWLEKLRSRVFLDMIADRMFDQPFLLDNNLLKEEQDLRSQLVQARSQEDVVCLNHRIQVCLSRLAQIPEAQDYVTLRQGQPIKWPRLLSLLDNV